MILAAQASRRFWELAGTWIHVERSEYRLANTYLRAGDVKKSVHHAEECVRMCHENNADADELKYANEIFAKAKQAAQQ
jgi:hypothetical protein